MKRLSLAIALAMSLLTTSAHAGIYTYVCRDHHKNYPVTLDTGTDDDCDGAVTSCTLTWRGTTFENVKQGQGCRAEYVATHNGVTVELCTATQGIADLKLGDATFNCKRSR